MSRQIAGCYLAGLFQHRHHRIADLASQQPGHHHHEQDGDEADDDAHGTRAAVKVGHRLHHVVSQLVVDLAQTVGFGPRLFQCGTSLVLAQALHFFQIAAGKSRNQLLVYREVLGTSGHQLFVSLLLLIGAEGQGAVLLRRRVKLLLGLVEGDGTFAYLLGILVEAANHLRQFGTTGIENGHVHLAGIAGRWQQVARNGGGIRVETGQLSDGEPRQSHH